jgi:hypothetical protein
MQKVVGSNPISRFFKNALHVGDLISALGAKNQMEPSPHIASILGTSSQDDADARG